MFINMLSIFYRVAHKIFPTYMALKFLKIFIFFMSLQVMIITHFRSLKPLFTLLTKNDFLSIPLTINSLINIPRSRHLNEHQSFKFLTLDLVFRKRLRFYSLRCSFRHYNLSILLILVQHLIKMFFFVRRLLFVTIFKKTYMFMQLIETLKVFLTGLTNSIHALLSLMHQQTLMMRPLNQLNSRSAQFRLVTDFPFWLGAVFYFFFDSVNVL